jgi:nitrite reductase (NADH) small subunit
MSTNSGSKWIRVTPAENIPPREGRAVRVGERSIALFNLGPRFMAVENRCPHQGGPLADGIVGGTTVTCPLHNWKICLETGTVSKPCDQDTPQVRTYPVKTENGIVLIELDPVAESAEALANQ